MFCVSLLKVIKILGLVLVVLPLAHVIVPNVVLLLFYGLSWTDTDDVAYCITNYFTIFTLLI